MRFSLEGNKLAFTLPECLIDDSFRRIVMVIEKTVWDAEAVLKDIEALSAMLNPIYDDGSSEWKPGRV